MTALTYFETGVVIYTVLAIARRKTFDGADKASIARGILFCMLLWPVGLIVVAIDLLYPRRVL
jgi:hypothetical protein